MQPVPATVPERLSISAAACSDAAEITYMTPLASLVPSDRHKTFDPRVVDIYIVNVLERDAHFTSFLHFSRLTTDEIVLKIIYKNYQEQLSLIIKNVGE